MKLPIPVNIACVVLLILNPNIQHILITLGPCIPKPSPSSLRFDVGMAMHEVVLQSIGQVWVQLIAYEGVSICNVVILCSMIALYNHWHTYTI